MKYLIPLVILISGCTTNSGIIPMDKGTYFISIRSPQLSFGPPVEQKADAYKQANLFCSEKKMLLETVDIKEINQVFGRHGSAQLTFRCVSK